MTLRALWIVDVHKETVVWERRWATVERRARSVWKAEHIPIPGDKEVLSEFLSALQKLPSMSDRVVALPRSNLWPFVFNLKGGCYFIALPLVDRELISTIASKDPTSKVLLGLEDIMKLPYSKIPSLTTTISVLDEIAGRALELLRRDQGVELDKILHAMIPFGRVMDTSFLNAQIALHDIYDPKERLAKGDKHPAWRPVGMKRSTIANRMRGIEDNEGKASLQITISETVYGALYDHEDHPDVCHIQGAIRIDCDFDGYPDVSFLTQLPKKQVVGSPPEVVRMSLHPCASASDVLTQKSVVFRPPLSCPFDVLTYATASEIEKRHLPVRGFYQMKEVAENKIRFLIQLKLSINVPNAFSQMVVSIPFYRMGTIEGIEGSPSQGSSAVHSNRSMIIWDVGQRMLGKSLEATFDAHVTFKGDGEGVPVPYDDPLLGGRNSYIKLRFRIPGATLTGLALTKGSLAVYPTCKCNTTVNREVIAKDYMIWNSLTSGTFYGSLVPKVM